MSDPTIEQKIQQAMQLQSSGKTADAEQAWRQILQKEPNNTTVLRILGSIFGQTGRSHEAVELLGRCVIVDPGDAAAHSMLGASLAAIGHKERAIQHLSRAVELQPTSAHLHYNYGKALRDQKQNEAAAAEFRNAIELQADFPPAWNNLANTLRDLGSLEEAYAAGQRAIALRPGNTQSLHNLGVICRDLLKLDEAMRLFDTALAYDPAFHECRLSRAMLLLLRGQYTLGWNEYEARFDVPRTMSRKEYGKPVWDGQDPEGRTVLLYCEQGFGDAIQFARYVPILAERGASVIVECRPELVKLFGSLRGVNQIVTPDEELPDFDAYRGPLSMPMISGTTVETIPADVPYLRPDRTQVRRWKRIIDPGSGVRVGLVWAGAAGYGNDHNRSIALEQLRRWPSVRRMLGSTVFRKVRPRSSAVQAGGDEGDRSVGGAERLCRYRRRHREPRLGDLCRYRCGAPGRCLGQADLVDDSVFSRLAMDARSVRHALVSIDEVIPPGFLEGLGHRDSTSRGRDG